ncbi:chromate transporter [Bosea sp. (in: a-proteobacteria)]|uniref:chromate transporter n=1 Tax=Bosea sp. (in: a-proteobacteria) TaxID=1871050 RepID=UPI0026315E08|nr:chromate transporter [Bosea sp. (in: a-proteobacteria)]MCO5092942.1 chromate transporter [Bosea sp. (in: a-proteobacteria)]
MPDILAERPSAPQLFLIFARIGLTSFGGGLSGWLLREFVQRRRLMSEEDFLNGLSIAQALPGVNVTNMAIWIGYKLGGRKGAIASWLGMVVPSAFLIVLIGSLFSALGGYELSHVALGGAAAAAIGLSLAMGLTAARRVPRRLFPLAIMALTFVAVAILKWPLIWTVLAAGSLSVAIAYRES